MIKIKILTLFILHIKKKYYLYVIDYINNNKKNIVMKKKLLVCFALVLFSAQALKSQTTTWNFSDATWTGFAGTSTNEVKNNLGFFHGTTSANLTGAVESNNANFTAVDGNSYTQRMKLNGGSYASGTTSFGTPTQRYLYFAVNGASTINISYKDGGSGTRILYVTDGTNVIASNSYTNSSDPLLFTVSYTGGAGNIYIAADQSLNFYQITATNVGSTATLGVSDLTANSSKSSVFTSDNQLYIKKVSADTKVSIYSANGSLVKSFNTKADTNLQLKTGVYIVNLQSAKGSQSQKVIVK